MSKPIALCILNKIYPGSVTEVYRGKMKKEQFIKKKEISKKKEKSYRKYGKKTNKVHVGKI
jgi:hypothetical protein